MDKINCIMSCGWDFQESEVAFPPYLSEQQLPSQKFACSKSTMETPEWRVMCLYCQFRAYFTHCYGVSIVDFEQVNADWVNINHRDHPANIYLLKVNYRNTRKRSEILLTLNIFHNFFLCFYC